MEQQNQQPIQEKTESKIPIKTNWKLFAIVTIIAVILALGGILLFRKVNTVIHESAIDICESDNECVLVPYTSCCRNVRAINKDHQEEYSNRPDWQQEHFYNDGELCTRIFCAPAPPGGFVAAKCLQNRCTPVGQENNGNSGSVQNWQTYHSEEFEFEIQYPPAGKLLKQVRSAYNVAN